MEENVIEHYAKYNNGKFIKIVRGFNYKRPYAVFKCANGHNFKLSFSNIRKNKWCYYCDLGYTDMDEMKRIGDRKGYRIIKHPENHWTCFQCINCKETIKLSKRPKTCKCSI